MSAGGSVRPAASRRVWSRVTAFLSSSCSRSAASPTCSASTTRSSAAIGWWSVERRCAMRCPFSRGLFTFHSCDPLAAGFRACAGLAVGVRSVGPTPPRRDTRGALAVRARTVTSCSATRPTRGTPAAVSGGVLIFVDRSSWAGRAGWIPAARGPSRWPAGSRCDPDEAYPETLTVAQRSDAVKPAAVEQTQQSRRSRAIERSACSGQRPARCSVTRGTASPPTPPCSFTPPTPSRSPGSPTSRPIRTVPCSLVGRALISGSVTGRGAPPPRADRRRNTRCQGSESGS